MSEMPRCFTETWPVARKPHKCCECSSIIPVGEKHHCYFGVWDMAETFRTCPVCEILRKEVVAKPGYMGGDFEDEPNTWPAFGRLLDHISRNDGQFMRWHENRRARGASQIMNWEIKKAEQIRAKNETP